MKRFASIGLLILVIFGGLFVYLNFFISSPTEVVREFCDAYDDSDVAGLVACCDPKTERTIDSILNLSENLTGIDFKSIIGISPLFGYEISDSDQKLEVSDVTVVAFSSNELSEEQQKMIFAIPGAGNLLGDTAVVQFTVNNTGTEQDDDRIVAQLTVEKYGSDGWRIPSDQSIEQVN